MTDNDTEGRNVRIHARFRRVHAGDRGHSLPSPGLPASLSLFRAEASKNGVHRPKQTVNEMARRFAAYSSCKKTVIEFLT